MAKAIQCPLCNGTGAYEPGGEGKKSQRKMVLDFFNIIKGEKKMTEFKIGDVVRLKGFHLAMTVADLLSGTRNDEIECIWFDLNFHIQVSYFKKETLEAAPEK